jgi:hypothetical protein
MYLSCNKVLICTVLFGKKFIDYLLGLLKQPYLLDFYFSPPTSVTRFAASVIYHSYLKASHLLHSVDHSDLENKIHWQFNISQQFLCIRYKFFSNQVLICYPKKEFVLVWVFYILAFFQLKNCHFIQEGLLRNLIELDHGRHW